MQICVLVGGPLERLDDTEAMSLPYIHHVSPEWLLTTKLTMTHVARALVRSHQQKRHPAFVNCKKTKTNDMVVEKFQLFE